MSLCSSGSFQGKNIVSGSGARIIVNRWALHALLVVTLLLSGCGDESLKYLYFGESATSIYKPEEIVFPSSKNSNSTSDIFKHHKRSLAGRIYIAKEDEDLWNRIRAGFKIPLPSGEAAQRIFSHERWFLENPDRLERMFSRVRLHMFNIVEAVEKEGLPMEVALSFALEGEFMPLAHASRPAGSLWGWGEIPSTGRRFFLDPGMFTDESPCVKEKVQAAMHYIKELSARYDGDFQIALAAYNFGEARTDFQVRKAKARGLPGRFEDLKLNLETTHYVSRTLALARLVSTALDGDRPEKITLPPMVYFP